jgi:porin
MVISTKRHRGICMIDTRGGAFRRLVLRLCMATLAANSWAEESTVPAGTPGLLDNGKISLCELVPTVTRVSGYGGDIWERSTLGGDFGGTRSDWYDKGFTVDMQVTQIYQGVTSGGAVAGNGNDKYNGLMEANAALDTGKLGWWSGGVLAVTAQTAWGSPITGEAGNISLVNMTPMWPEPFESKTLVDEYYLAQGLPGEMLLVVGRIDATNFLDTNSYANIPEAQFFNGSLNNDLLWGELLSFSTYAALLVVPVSEHFAFATAVWTPETLPDDVGGDWGSYAAVINPIFTYKLGDQAGKTQVTYAYSSADTAAFDNPRIAPNLFREFISDKEGIPGKDDNWLATFNLEQHLWTPQEVDGSFAVPTQDFANNPPGIGFFFRAGYVPENRNPYNLTMSGGLGARGIIPGRPLDRMGIGVYAMFASDDFKDASLILDEVMDDEVGFEVYYNFAVTPWLQISADVQWVDQGISTSDDAWILGSRLNIRF